MFRLLFLTLLARGQNVAVDPPTDATKKHQEAEQKVIDAQQKDIITDAQALFKLCGYEFFEWSDCMYANQMDGSGKPGNRAVPMKRRALKKSNSAEWGSQCRCTGTCNCPDDPTKKCSVLGYVWSKDQENFEDGEYVSQKKCSDEEKAALDNPASEKCAYTFASEPKKKCQDDDKQKDSETCTKLITASKNDPTWLTCINFNINGSTSYKQAFPITEAKRGKAKGDCVGAVEDSSFTYDTKQCQEIQYTGKCWQAGSEILEPVKTGTPRFKSFDDADCTPPPMPDEENNCEYTYSEQPKAECVSFVPRNFLEAGNINGFTSVSEDAQKNLMPTDSAFYKVHLITAVKRKDPLQRGSCDALNRANWTIGIDGSLRINENKADCTYAKTQASHEMMKNIMEGNMPAQAEVQSLNDDQPGPQLTTAA